MQPMLPRMIISQQVMKMLPNHRAARTARRDDIVIPLEILDHFLGQLARLIVKPIIEKRLPTTRLRLRKRNLTPVMLKDLRHRNPYVRIKLVRQTCNEKGNIGHSSSAIR